MSGGSSEERHHTAHGGQVQIRRPIDLILSFPTSCSWLPTSASGRKQLRPASGASTRLRCGVFRFTMLRRRFFQATHGSPCCAWQLPRWSSSSSSSDGAMCRTDGRTSWERWQRHWRPIHRRGYAASRHCGHIGGARGAWLEIPCRHPLRRGTNELYPR